MRHIYFIILISTVIFFSGCEENIDWDAPAPWRPQIIAKKTNNSTQLHINQPPSNFNETALYPRQSYSTPDYFTVYFSETGIEDWNKYGNFKYSDNLKNIIEIENLTENIPYYFKIISVGKNNKESESDPVMIITGKSNLSKEKVNDILNNRIAHRFSPDKKLEAYHRDYSWETNKSARSVIIQNIATQKETLIEIKSSAPAWSPNQNKVAFLSENVLVNNNNSNQSTSLISIFDLEKDTIIRLTERYFGFQLSWSHNGEWITYTLKSPENDEYNIWKVNTFTKENLLVQGDIGGLDNLVISDDKSPRNPVFSYNDEEIFFSRRTRNSRYYPHNIFTVSAEGGEIEQVTNSYWNDDLPKSTSDGKFISFASNRTGESQIWGKDILTNELFQFTEEETINANTPN